MIFLYSNTILQTVLTADSGFTAREGVYMISLVNTLSAGIGIYAMNAFGRRSLTLWGGIGIVLSHYAIGTCIIMQYNVGTLVMMCAFIFFYQNSSGPVAWVYAQETLTDAGLGATLNVLYGSIFVLSLATEPLMNSALHPSGVFFLLGTFGLMAVIFTIIWLKESKGLTEKEKKSLYVPFPPVEENFVRTQSHDVYMDTETAC